MVKEAERSHAALSLEMERAAADGKSEQDFYTTEWGNRPTRQFFAQTPNVRQSGGIDSLHRHTTRYATTAPCRSTTSTASMSQVEPFFQTRSLAAAGKSPT
jgi:hypothetical protein